MRGFTLLEVMVYIALYSGVFVGMISSAYALKETATRVSARAHALQDRIYAADLQDQGIHDASGSNSHI